MIKAGTDKSGTRGKRNVYYTVHCDIHGVKRPCDVEKTVIVAPTTGRRAKKAGCPACKRESKNRK